MQQDIAIRRRVGNNRASANQVELADRLQMSGVYKAHPQLLNALASLNEIGSAINDIEPGDSASIEAALPLIVQSAIKVVPGTSAVIYTYDHTHRAFAPSSRVSAGEQTPPVPGDEPRPNGMGNRAINQRRRILSYEEEGLDIHPVKIDAGAKAVACFPLVVAEQAVGALYVYLHDDREFSDLELLLLENFVNQAAMAIYHARQMTSIQRDLARREDEVARLHRAGLLISSRLRLEETLEAILQMALDVTGAQYGNFWLVDEKGKCLTIAVMAGERLSRPFTDNIPLNSPSITTWVAGHRQAVCIPDLRVEPWASIYCPFDHDLEMRSELAVPLINASGRLQGVLNLESPTPNAFSKQDKLLLQALATQAVIAIQEVLLLDALKEIAERLLTEPQKQVLERLAELAAELLNAADVAIWVLEDDRLVLQAANAGHEHRGHVPLRRSLVGQAVLRRQAVLSDDVQTDPRFYQSDLARAQGWTRALVVPLQTNEDQEPIGAFSVYCVDDDPRRLAESEWIKKVLTILADYATFAVLDAARQEALQAAQDQRTVAETFAALGDIAANLLHQLNNKVGIIPVRVQGIQDKCQAALVADSYLATNLAEIEEGAREAMRVVQENLALLRPITLVPVDLAACVQEAISTIDLPPGVRIRIEDLDGLPPVKAGRQSLRLVFTNLLENATHAMNDTGIVTIRGTIRRDDVRIEVSDTGPGIAPELHGHIFEFNFSGHPSAHAGKLGFGLWWVKMLMTRLGGSITVESDGQSGTTFHLRLPCVSDDSSGSSGKELP